MSWEDILKVRRRPKKKLPPSNPFAGESKRHEETVAGKLEAEQAEEAARQAKLDEEKRLVQAGKVRFHRLEETDEGHRMVDEERTSRPRKGVLSERRCSMCGVAISRTSAKRLSRGKGDPNKNLKYCEDCAGLLAGTKDAKEFKPLDIQAFTVQRKRGGRTPRSRQHWRNRKK